MGDVTVYAKVVNLVIAFGELHWGTCEIHAYCLVVVVLVSTVVRYRG